MGFKSFIIFVAISAALVFYAYWSLFGSVPAPKVDIKKYWGPSNRKNKTDSPAILPFKIGNSTEMINDLRKRLTESTKVKLIEPLEGVGFRYGFHKSKVGDIIKYWNDDYLPRWTERQNFLNKFPQFETEIQGLKIHFIHAKGQDAKARKTIPLLLLHGWPGSVREFYELIPKLTTPNSKTGVQFTVVAPSLVGYGWSEGASIPGLAITEMSVIIRNLMIKLGYKKFLVQGGDLGSVTGSALTTLFPGNVIGYHSNMCVTLSEGSLVKGFIASFMPHLFVPEEFESFHFPLVDKFKFLIEEGGYFHIQATKPDTIGIALSHNPVGLAVYILEKFSTGTNLNYRLRDDGGLDRDYPKDALLDNIMIYYLTNSITTSARLYSESFSIRGRSVHLEHVTTSVPTGCARFQYDIYHELDWHLIDKFHNLIHSTYHKDGGHFIALQSPEILYEDFVDYVHKLEGLEFV